MTPSLSVIRNYQLRARRTETDRPAELLDATDVVGKRIVDTRLQPRITIGAENAAAAFEVMSRC